MSHACLLHSLATGCDESNNDEALITVITIILYNKPNVKPGPLEIAHKSIQRVYLLQNWVEAPSYWAVLFAKTANAIGLLPEKTDTGNLQGPSSRPPEQLPLSVSVADS
jgi:hypothetical protein